MKQYQQICNVVWWGMPGIDDTSHSLIFIHKFHLHYCWTEQRVGDLLSNYIDASVARPNYHNFLQILVGEKGFVE